MSEKQKLIEERVISVVEEVLRVPRDSIAPETKIKDDLGADSLDTVSLLMALEEEFDYSISDEEAEGLDTIGKVNDFIRSKAAAIGKSA